MPDDAPAPDRQSSEEMVSCARRICESLGGTAASLPPDSGGGGSGDGATRTSPLPAVGASLSRVDEEPSGRQSGRGRSVSDAPLLHAGREARRSSTSADSGRDRVFSDPPLSRYLAGDGSAVDLGLQDSADAEGDPQQVWHTDVFGERWQEKHARLLQIAHLAKPPPGCLYRVLPCLVKTGDSLLQVGAHSARRAHPTSARRPC